MGVIYFIEFYTDSAPRETFPIASLNGNQSIHIIITNDKTQYQYMDSVIT